MQGITCRCAITGCHSTSVAGGWLLLILLVVQVNQWNNHGNQPIRSLRPHRCRCTVPWQWNCVYFGHSRLPPCLWHQWAWIKNTPKHSQGDARLSWTCAGHEGELLLAASFQHWWIRSLMLGGRWTPTQVPATQTGPKQKGFFFYSWITENPFKQSLMQEVKQQIIEAGKKINFAQNVFLVQRK